MRKSVLLYWTLSHGASGKLPLATDDSCTISFFLSKISFAHNKQKQYKQQQKSIVNAVLNL